MGPTFAPTDWDDRREIVKILEHLTPNKRIEWLAWCCREASFGQAVEVKIVRSSGDAREVHCDFLSIVGQGRLTLQSAGRKLEQLARGK